MVKSDPSWAGVWRRRLALKTAAAVAQNLLNRREDEAALRDAIALAKPGQELGPAGRVYSAFRMLAGPGDPLRPARLSAVAADLQAPLDPEKAAELAAALRETGGRGRPAPIAAAAAAEAVTALKPDAEPLAIFSPTPRWPGASAGQRRCRCSPASFSCAAPQARDGGRARARPAGASSWRSLMRGRRSPPSTWRRTCRAGRPGSPTPRQNCAPRGRRAPSRRCSPTTPSPPRRRIAGLSDRARRRLFDRLVALGAARELTGRPTFRLYGL